MVGMVAALLCVSICLYVLFAARGSLQGAAAEVNLSVMVIDDSGIEGGEIARSLSEIEGVSTARYVDSLDAQRDFSAYLGVDITSVLGEGAIPSSFIVSVDPLQADRRSVDRIKGQIEGEKWAQSVSYDSTIVDRFDKLSARIDQFATWFTAVLAAIATVMLYVICRQSAAIMAHSMVSAPARFVKRAIMQRAVVNGAVAGVGSAALLFVGVYGLQGVYPSMGLPTDLLPLIACSVLVAGFIVNLLFSYISTLLIFSK